MRLATVNQTKEIDRRAQVERALSAEAMMEAAGSVAAREIVQAYLPELLASRGIAVACGPGGNGADGLVVARHLRSAGVRSVVVVLCAPDGKRTALFRLQLERAQKGDVVVRDALADASAWEELRRAGVVVDALLGVGLVGPVRAPFDRAVEELNARRGRGRWGARHGDQGGPVVSLDAPSGLDCDRGVAAGARLGEGLAVRADMTICFGLSRPGLYISDGPRLCGRLRRVAIGVPQSLAREVADTVFAFGENEARAVLPRRASSSNKSTHGRALVIAGGEGSDGRAMWGAGMLASSAAYRAGAGYVTWASWWPSSGTVSSWARRCAGASLPEALTATVDGALLASSRDAGAVVIGPGLNSGQRTADAVRGLIEAGAARVVIDAGALDAAAREGLFPLPSSWIATPHAGELARLLRSDARAIESDRLRFARAGADALGCRVLLKGFRSVVAAPSSEGGRQTIILSGNAALAKAGTGDVLAGAIAGFLAQGMEIDGAAALGAWAHGRVADEWTKSGKGKGSLSASDVRDLLPSVLGALAAPRSGRGGFA